MRKKDPDLFKVYIQKIGGEFPNDICFTAFEGFDHAGNEIKFFEDIHDVPTGFDKHGRPPLVVGFLEDTSEYLKIRGIEVPKPLDIPNELMAFTDRKIEIKTLGEFKKETNLPIFVKPHSRFKAFKSGVMKDATSRRDLFNKDDLGNTLDDNMEVLTSEVVDMLSEYRCFVKKGELVGIRQYQGDFTIFPNVETIKEMISAYKSAPKAYSLDVAVVENPSPFLNFPPIQKTVLVEAQDMWSIGPYGLPCDIYASCLKFRWFEIFKNKSK